MRNWKNGRTLQRRYNGCDGISNLQPHNCLLNRLFRPRSKKTSKLGITGLCGGNSPVTGEFPAQRANNTENVSIWWCHHDWARHSVTANTTNATFCSCLFTNDFSIIIQIRWKFHSALIHVVMKKSLWNFSHGMTAGLSWHVQIFLQNNILQWNYTKTKICIEYVLQWKNRWWNVPQTISSGKTSNDICIS